MSDLNSNRSTKNVVSLAGYRRSSTISNKRYAEKPLQAAPVATIRQESEHGETQIEAVPQQFFEVTRTLESLEAILAELDFDPNYPYFAGLDGRTLYIQVGIIGVENYPGCKQPLNTPKIVYGRKWLIETATPTSEVIQTVFLATQKAREHELREHLYLVNEAGTERSTPFNTHLDLPLMSRLDGWQKSNESNQVHSLTETHLRDVLSRVRFGDMPFNLKSLTQISNDLSVVSVELSAENKLFPEFNQAVIPVIVNNSLRGDVSNLLLHAVMDAMLAHSNNYVREQFTFKGFARFSQSVDVEKLGSFSVQSRKVGTLSEDFTRRFRAMNTQVDSQRAPRLNSCSLRETQLRKINRFTSLEGFVPS